MNREVLRWLFLISLLVVFSSFGAFRWWQRTTHLAAGGEELRFSHTLLSPGIREAFHEVAREFSEALLLEGRNVRVIQLDVPERTYTQWLRTQLVGGTAPEIVMIEHANGFDDALMARHFLPLSNAVSETNRWNRGTPLEDLAWRNTFFDGLETAGFNFRLNEHYGVPLSAQTIRVFANRSLLERALSDPAFSTLRPRLASGLVPTTYEDFLALAEGLQVYADTHRLSFTPLAGSGQHAELLFQQLMAAETQGLRILWDPLRNFLGGDLLLDVVRGRRDWLHPAFRQGHERIREVSQFFPRGFTQMRRDDAVFQFVQERSVFFVSTSGDYSVLEAMIANRFPLLVWRFPIPEPGPDDRAGQRLGPFGESGSHGAFIFCILQGHPPEQEDLALDFLRYLTSHPGNSRFAHSSGWLPSVIEISMPDHLQPLAPVAEGYPEGLRAHFHQPDLQRIWRVNLHHLTGPQGDVDTFLAAIRPEFNATIPLELTRWMNRFRNNLRMQDLQLLALEELSRLLPEEKDTIDRRREERLDAIELFEADLEYTRQHSLPYLTPARSAVSPPLQSP